MTAVKTRSETTVVLTNVRIAFPEVFEAKQFEGKGPFKYAATFLIKPGSDNDTNVRAALAKAAKDKWGDKTEAILKTIDGQSQKYCYLDGNTKDYDGYAGMWALSAKRDKEQGPVLVLDRSGDPKAPLTVADGRPYGGCYVNAKLTIWAQDNEWGKGMRSTLATVQFHHDDAAFGGAGPATADGFGEVVEEDASDLR